MLVNPKLPRKPLTDITRQALVEKFRNLLTADPQFKKFGPTHQALAVEAIRYRFENEELKPLKATEKLKKEETEAGATPRTSLTFKFEWEMPGLGHKIELELAMWESEYERLGR